MTAQNTLKAALEKHNIYFDDWTAMTWVAILEAMQQHRAEAIEEVEKFVNEMSESKVADTSWINALLGILKHKLAALKSLRGSGE